ncbi:hypothetical protein [Methylobacterium sp. WSM2598]|uniref:hypothetical protein n=1 Tax=Methylobacterium sp. WSM2598 TaxID=398261 RepID=UPI00037B5536|nr:hypothetical protein [Methylobacterium sp. WSM2598]
MNHPFGDREHRAPAILAGLAALGMAAMLIGRGLFHDAGSNSYGALADALLHGRVWVESCPEIDCARFDGRTYIVFPPLPALVAMPFVAWFGFPGFKGFVLLGLALSTLSLLIWSRIFGALAVDRRDAPWLILALAFASPLFQVTLRADGVWFFAQVVGFLMTSLSLWAVVCRGSFALACLFAALAFLCRQMTILYPLFLLAVALPPGAPLRAGLRGLAGPLARGAVPLAAALILVLAYDAARFGNPLETGYAFIDNPDSQGFIWRRLSEIGLFSPKYALFNAVYLLLQGVHVEFGGPYRTEIIGLDKAGVALAVSSPWILLAACARIDRVFAAGAAVIGLIAGTTLLYHSNGAEQIATQRYTLDWLPILLVLMLRAPRPAAFAALPLLVTWGVVTNAAFAFLASVYRL